jgi:Phosphotransferase enzyme family
MDGQQISAVERAVFGGFTRDEVVGWLDRHLRARLGTGLQELAFCAGRVAPVYGLRLCDGRELVAKVHRCPVDVGRLSAVARCQQRLAAAEFPCPRPIGEPAATAGHVVVLETFLDRGRLADAHRPQVRRSMAWALAQQVVLLKDVRADILATGKPAWAAHEHGPWPTPHDPLFDFTRTPRQYRWIDQLARRAADLLDCDPGPTVIGHSDWVCQNLRFRDATLAAAYDWDSLIACSEPVLAGLAAGAHTEGSSSGADAPTPEQVAAFLAEYTAHRATAFTAAQQRAATAAATWVLCYNARCGVSTEALGHPAADGSPLRMLSRYRGAYLAFP